MILEASLTIYDFVHDGYRRNVKRDDPELA
jgi:hypothetical protein